MRTEQEIFLELESICRSPGFIHAIARIQLRDGFVTFNEKLCPEDLDHLFHGSRLIRTEFMILVGLLIRGPIDFAPPSPTELSEYISRTYELLSELHATIVKKSKTSLEKNQREQSNDAFGISEALREPIFYGGETAYSHQYRDLALKKYSADTDWLLQNKRIDFRVANEVCSAVSRLIDWQITRLLMESQDNLESPTTFFEGFQFSCKDISKSMPTHSVESVQKVIEAFCLPEGERNSNFTSVDCFNVAYAYPILRIGPRKYFLANHYSFSEAIYNTPFYWMLEDVTYKTCAFTHRGEFTEKFAAERLEKVFGSESVFRNVSIYKTKNRILGEIDVLVLFPNFAIVVQAKSKKLTQLARGGNRLQLQSDFKSAIQNSVDQASKCASLLSDSTVMLRDVSGRKITIDDTTRRVYLMSVIADSYPALILQVQQFLEFNHDEDEISQHPLVIDVFALDTLTEVLDSPLKLLHYLEWRAISEKIFFANHERVLISYYIGFGSLDLAQADLLLHDDISSDLDAAMAVRRDDIPGDPIPSGRLVQFSNETPLARMLCDLERNRQDNSVELGFMLLSLYTNKTQSINDCIRNIVTKTENDGQLHDVALASGNESTGLTIHCSYMIKTEARNWLRWHCERRMSIHRKKKWFGVSLQPNYHITSIIVLGK